MGYVKQKYQKDMIGSIKILDLKPVWIGTSDRCPHIERYMTAEKAEQWVKGSPDRRIILKAKKYELEKF